MRKRKSKSKHHSQSSKQSNANPVHGPKPTSVKKYSIQGVLQLKGKEGFVLSVTDDPDVLIEGPTLRFAMDGDTVEARVFKKTETRFYGDLIRIVSRGKDTVVGTLMRTAQGPCLRLDQATWSAQLVDPISDSVKEGDVLVCQMTRWPSEFESAQAKLIKILGAPDLPTTDLPKLIAMHDLSSDFPHEVETEAERFGSDVPESSYKGRTTFFDQPVFTIDGADAKDFDDAVSIEKTSNGWVLGVHIADVSHYVTEHSRLDEEAIDRGTSVYFPGQVLPMLPFALSDELCSLRPDCVRLTLSCLMTISRDGEVVKTQVMESAIRSIKRFTYEEVEHLLTGQTISSLPPRVSEAVLEMGGLARLLRKKRYQRGSLDFDFPEPKVIIGSDGTPADIQKRGRLESHRLIEEFMLLANESVARWMKDVPFLYRIHETPDPTKLANLKNTLLAFGTKVPKDFEKGNPKVLQGILDAIKGKPYESLIQMLTLRSLKQAVYSSENRGHFGLASRAYTHFTSPIRRYPDLIVHRLLRERLQQKLNPERQKMWKKRLSQIAQDTSDAERRAVKAERDYMDVLKVRLLEKHVGEEFDGIVVSVTNFGLFIQLNDYFVEGLVHITSLEDDYYVYDETRMTLRGRRTGRTYQLNQPVRIRVVGTNLTKAQVDFNLVS